MSPIERAVYDVWHHRVQKPRFCPSTRKRQSGGVRNAFKKKTSLRTVLKNLRFWCPKVPLKCGQKAKTGKKFFLLKNNRIRADAGPYYPYFTIKLSSLEALNRLVIIYNLSFNYQCWNNHLSCGTTSNWARLSLTHSQELKAIAAKV